MHIGLLIYGELTTISGGYLYDRQLVTVLQNAGHTVEIVSLPWRNYAQHLTDNCSSTLLQRLHSAPFDLLLQDELNHPSLAWLNARLRSRAHYPIMSIVHHLRSSEAHPRYLLPLYRWVEQRYLQSVDGFLYNSATTRRTVMALAANNKSQILAYPAANHRQPPATADIFRRVDERASENARLEILFVGTVIARKGLHHLLRALVMVPLEHWRLTVVGSLSTDPDYVAQIMRQLTALQLADQVTLHGSCSDAAVANFYRQSDLFVAPAYEGFGIAYLEAMSFGLPVIASTAGAAHEIVTDNVNGYLVAPDDSTTLASHINTLCRDRTLLVTMAHAARQRYDCHPTWEESFTPVVRWLEEQT